MGNLSFISFRQKHLGRVALFRNSMIYMLLLEGTERAMTIFHVTEFYRFALRDILVT